MNRARQLALLIGLSLLGSFITVMIVHYMLPFDPFTTEPLINYRILFVTVVVVIGSALSITHVAARRTAT